MVVISNFKSISNQLTILKFITVTIFSILLFLQSVFWVKESGIIKIYEARENVVSLVKTRTQTYVEDAPSLFWISEKRLYSADGNLNWRLDIWQDVILDLSNKDKILFGYGYNEIIPIMEWYGGYRLGLDGLNEHVHNNWFNIFARGGLLHLVLFIFLYIFLVSSYRKKFGDYWIFLLIVPILFVSFFDSSMENAHFPFIYYFFLGRLFVIGK
jgi:O-antigen ligase